MPPKPRVTRDMILDAAFALARECGAEHINARTVSARLNCSTQPVMYHFKTIEELKRAVYQKADAFHTAYLMNVQDGNPMLGIGMQYIRFGAREKHLFRFLFQTNEFSGKNVSELIGAEEIQPVIAILSQAAEIGTEQAQQLFRSLFLLTHGYASMFANNEIAYDEATIAADLTLAYTAILSAVKGGQ